MRHAPQPECLNQHILLIEDEWATADELAKAFRGQGASIVGPVPTVSDALLTLGNGHSVHGAVVDINLPGEMAYAVADLLMERGIPFIFLTAYGRTQIPEKYNSISLCLKPFTPEDVVRAWSSLDMRSRLAARRAFMENQLLARLDERARTELVPYIEVLDLPIRARIGSADAEGCQFCHFLLSGLASCSLIDRKRESVEIALIGREGAVGLAPLGSREAVVRSEMLTPGSVAKVDAAVFARVLATAPEAAHMMLKASEDVLRQAAGNLLAAARYNVEQRVARWLLVATERARLNALPVTHEAVAMALGVRRAGVSLALGALRECKAIEYSRREITVVNRALLVDASGGAYTPAEASPS